MAGRTFDVPLDVGMPDGSIKRQTFRVSAGSKEEAGKLALAGKGVLLQPGPGETRPTQTPEPRMYAEPPAPAPTTVYNPGTPPGPPPGSEPPGGMLSSVFEAVAPPVARFAGKAALPMAGSLALGLGGGAVPGLNAVPPPVREAIGSVLGTGANMLLGIEEPSMQQLLMSAATPAAARGGGRLGTNLLPGAKAARATGLVEEAGKLPGVIERGVTADPAQLFAAARQATLAIPLTDTGAVASTLLKTERQVEQSAKGLQYDKIRSITNHLDALAQQSGTSGVPLADLDEIRQRIGAEIGGATNPKERGAYKQLYASILRDIEAVASQTGGDAAATLLEGIQMQRRQFAADDLRDIISGPSGAISQPRPVDGLQTFNAAKVLKELERPHKGNELLVQFLDAHPDEKQEIVDLLTDMNRRNVKLRPPAGAMFGFGALAGRAGGAGALASMTGAMAPETAAGLALVGSEVISRSLLTPTGRGFLRQAMSEGPTLNTTQLLFQMLGQGTRGSLGPAPGVTLGLQE